MIQVIVTSPEVKELRGTNAKGKAYHLRIQTAYAATVSESGEIAEIPDKFEFFLDENQPPFARGKYLLAPSSVYVSREGRLEISPRLVAPAAAK